MEYLFRPSGVCSREIIIDIEDDTVNSVFSVGGCNGNGKGIGALCSGQKVDDIISRLKGLTCGMKSTSCPDQLAAALEYIKANKDK